MLDSFLPFVPDHIAVPAQARAAIPQPTMVGGVPSTLENKNSLLAGTSRLTHSTLAIFSTQHGSRYAPSPSRRARRRRDGTVCNTSALLQSAR